MYRGSPDASTQGCWLHAATAHQICHFSSQQIFVSVTEQKKRLYFKSVPCVVVNVHTGKSLLKMHGKTTGKKMTCITIKEQATAHLWIVTHALQHFWFAIREGRDRPLFLEAPGLLFFFFAPVRSSKRYQLSLQALTRL